MDRVSKTNQLLMLTLPRELIEALRRHFQYDQTALATIQSLIDDADPDEESQSVELWEEIDRLYLQRETLIKEKKDTSEIDAGIVALKRTQREGRQLRAGAVLGSRYRLMKEVGEGGFATVWKAFDLEEKRLVAIKVLHARLAGNDQSIRRFRRGAFRMKALDHPHILRVLDGPAVDKSFHYFVMDYLPNGDFSEAVANKKLDLTSALSVLLQVGSALTYAHKRNLIHRDVKPQNILLDEQGRGRLTDFDLVWASDTTGHTNQGGMGTFVFAPPEQMENAGGVDARADVYSLAMTALFVLNGGALPRNAILKRERFIAGLACAGSAKDLLLQATDIERDGRPADMDKFCTALSSAFELHPASPPSRPRSKRVWLIIVPGCMALAGTALIGPSTLLGSLRSVLHSSPSNQSPPTAPVPLPMPARNIRWELTTTPTGVEVVRATDGASLGSTPWSIDQVASSGKEHVILRSRGYMDRALALDKSRSVVQHEELTPLYPPDLAEPTLAGVSPKATVPHVPKKRPKLGAPGSTLTDDDVQIIKED